VRSERANALLYLSTILIWGSTWLAIKFQLGIVAPEISVCWRFGAAALMLAALARLRGLSLRVDLRTHAWLALQGCFLFGINYILVYVSEQSLTSGLVAVTFTLIVLFNIVFLKIFFGTPMKPHTLAGAVLGVVGVAVLFWPDLADFSFSTDRRIGLIECLVSTVMASIGNMVATRNHRHQVPVISGNAWAMLYGALFVGLYAAIAGRPFRFDTSLPYVASLLYLALFGSVFAFLAYLTLLGRIGADRAGYSAVVTPMIAMILSTFFEGLQWNAWIACGMALCLVGNLLVLPVANKSSAKSSRDARTA
jgi:drug/metabolite transporter (DMT)-like permease